MLAMQTGFRLAACLLQRPAIQCLWDCLPAGGPIEAGTLTASSVDLSSSGGSITVRKLMGLNVSVAAGDAEDHFEQ